MTDLLAKARAVAAHAGELEGLAEQDAARRAVALLAREELHRVCVPADFGGFDLATLATSDEVSVRALCKVRDELAYASGMLDVMFVMQGLGSYALARGGSDELRRGTLPAVAAGERIAAFALTEEGAGSSLGEISTRARRDGANWRIDGAKTFISNAGIADFYTLLARTSGEPGDGGRGSLSMFYVPAASTGLRVEPFEVMAPHPIGTVVFEDVVVPEDYLLGDEGAGLELALATLGRFRTSVAAAANGIARRALDESVARLEKRSQFGRPLSSFQALRFDLAEMDTRLRAAQLLTEEAADRVDRGENSGRQVARAKLFATETAFWICDRAVQHFGGLGVKRGSTVERLFREVRALRIYEGTSEIQKLVLAKELLAAHREQASE